MPYPYQEKRDLIVAVLGVVTHLYDKAEDLGWSAELADEELEITAARFALAVEAYQMGHQSTASLYSKIQISDEARALMVAAIAAQLGYKTGDLAPMARLMDTLDQAAHAYCIAVDSAQAQQIEDAGHAAPDAPRGLSPEALRRLRSGPDDSGRYLDT